MMYDLISELLSNYNFIKKRNSSDWPALNVPSKYLFTFCKILKNKYNFNILADISGIDLGENKESRFAVVYQIFSIKRNFYIRIFSLCTDNIKPTIPSLASIWSAANWHEREAYDMFGIIFIAHPNLQRILMWNSYPHHPLRKDFPLAGINTNFPSQDIRENTNAKVEIAPMDGGPFFANSNNCMSKNEPKAYDQSWSESKQKI